MKRRLIVVVAAIVCTFAAVLAPPRTTLASWPDAEYATGSFTAGGLAYTHAYNSTTCSSVAGNDTPVACTGAISPTAATPLTGTVDETDDITADGTLPAASVTQQVSAASCGPVKLDDSLDSANPHLPRYATVFNPTSGPLTGSGSITVDGSSAYTSNIVNETQPDTSLILNQTFALGIFFKTTTTAGGVMFSYNSNPLSILGVNHRILYMNTAGKVGFGFNTNNGYTGLSSSAYNDGNWHWAFITMTVTGILGLTAVSTITLYIDGSSVASGGGLLVGISGDTGYWHLGWGPVTSHSYGSGLSNYLDGSLSNLVVWNGGNASSTLKNLGGSGSQSTFDSNLGTEVTDHWQLNETGKTTYSGQYPPGVISACSMLNLTWGFTNPTSCAWSPQSKTNACNTVTPSTLAAFVAAGWQEITAPAPAGTQTSTISLSRAASYTVAYMPGLRVYAPLSFRGTCGGWSTTFSWPDAAAAFVG